MIDENFKIQYTRGSGPGGQHKNKTETCVVITHIPTGLSERCQDTRSKTQNLKIAKGRLINKINNHFLNLEKQEKQKKREKLLKNKNIVRTYSYTRNEVYDHRTKVKRNLKKVLNRNLDF